MSNLIERLEKSFGPDFGIDRAIAAALRIEWSADEEGQFGGYGIMPRRVRFTASIDAALTLVPKGCSWMVALSSGDSEQPGARVWSTMVNYGTEDFALHGSFAATPAIALCIAALKARTAEEQTQDSDT